MDYNKYLTAKENTVITYIVFNEHTLGYLFRSGNHLCMGILHPSVLRGSPWNKLTGNISILPHEFKNVREATQKDFDNYNVSSKNHLSQSN